MNSNQFASPLPYPSLDGVHPNWEDLFRMEGNYSGLVSELTAITQYVYHQLNAKGEGDKKIASTLLSIAQIEMRHLNLFGEAIIKLGGDPQFRYPSCGDLTYWDGALVDSCRQLRPMLLSDLKLERETILCYTSQAEATSQPQLAALLWRIIADEIIHVQILQGLIDNLDKPTLKD